MAKAKKTILLFDNDPALVGLYKNVFEEAGYNFIVTDNINKAVRFCRQEKVDLVLSNMLLTTDPKTNESLGFIFLKSIKTLPKTQNIPTVILSNLSMTEKQNQASRLGADAFLVKSNYTPKQILNKVEKFLSARLANASA